MMQQVEAMLRQLPISDRLEFTMLVLQSVQEEIDQKERPVCAVNLAEARSAVDIARILYQTGEHTGEQK